MAVKGLIYFEFMPEIWQAYTMEECIHILGFREIFFFPELNNDGMVVVDFITAVVFKVEKCQRQCTNKNTILLTRWLFFLSCFSPQQFVELQIR